jgi:hypothetical protein
MNYKIIDNAFDIDFFKNFQKNIFDTTIPWFYRQAQIYNYNEKKEYDDFNLKVKNQDLGYFSIGFFNNYKEDYKNLNNFLYEVYNKLQCKSLIESRANLTLKINKKNKSLKFHTDKPFANSYTAILYMNTNDGGTFLLDKNKNKQIKINSLENRLLIMDGDIFHAADVQTDTKRRIIININYF